jgi:hypothetical protein
VSTPTSRRTSSGPWIGIALGVVILGLVAAFAIGLPKATGDEGGETAQSSTAPISLPAKLPGGYISSDDPTAFAGGQLATQAHQIATQEEASRKYGNRVLPRVLGVPAATRTYVAQGTQAVFVQAFRAQGGAFAPNSIPDPATSGGQASTEMKRVGAGVCILSYSQSAQGQAPTLAFTQCQVSKQGLTVQIGSSSVADKTLVGAADALIGDLAKQ